MRHSPKSVIAPPERIIVVRALPGLGDLLCAVPAFRALRHGFPQAQITLLGLPATKTLVQRFSSYLDSFLPFPGYPGMTEQKDFPQLLPFLAGQRGRYDLALQLHGSGRASNAFTALLGARFTAGYQPSPAGRSPGITKGHFLPWPEAEREPDIWLRLLASLGVPSCGRQLEFPLAHADFDALDAIPAAARLQPGNYVCLHPGASEPARRMPAAQFAVLADELAASGLQVVLTGTAAERPLAEAVELAARSTPLNLAGRTTLGALAALLHGARLLVCNDTGVSHLAAALGVRSVVVFIASDPRRWAPLDGELHLAAGSGQTEGSSAPAAEPRLADVLHAVHHQLERTGPLRLAAATAATARQEVAL